MGDTTDELLVVRVDVMTVVDVDGVVVPMRGLGIGPWIVPELKAINCHVNNN